MLRTILRKLTHIDQVLSLPDFIKQTTPILDLSKTSEPLPEINLQGLTYKLETYGCQMNVNDSQIIESLLQSSGLSPSSSLPSDVILLNTCAIREKAESRIFQRISELKQQKADYNTIICILGCMAERLKHDLLESQSVDIVAGPDAYRSLPLLISAVHQKSAAQAINTQLSLEETYADITPVRNKGISAFLSIMRGCNNMCSFCVVPFTRGRERSRDFDSIVEEVKRLAEQGVKEVVLLGQNVNSYWDQSKEFNQGHRNSKGFRELYKLRQGKGARFADLLSGVAEAAPNLRIRFTSPHPKDFPPEVLQVISTYPNVCNSIHLPLQSGSDRILEKMRRNYTQQAYLDLVDDIRTTIPDVTITTDIIAGFCGETEKDHQSTLDVIKKVQFDQAFMFAYSLRGKTHAFNNYTDDVPQEVKQRRLEEIIETVHQGQGIRNLKEVGKVHEVLLDGRSKKRADAMTGLTGHNKRVVVYGGGEVGEVVRVQIEEAGKQTLYGVKVC